MTKKKILFVCPYPKNVAPSQRLKFEQYYKYFEEEGYAIDIAPFIGISFWNIIYKPGQLLLKVLFTLKGYAQRLILLFKLHQYELVYIHLWVTPFGPPIFERLYKIVSKKIVYDIDDLIYLDAVKSKSNPIVTSIKGHTKPIYLMKVADHIITCTPYLDQFVQKYNIHTTDISSTINTEVYKRQRDYAVNEKTIIGWSGSHTTAKYLHLLDDVFRTLAKKYCFKLLVMGDENFAIEGVEVEALPWKSEYEVDVIRRFDIGVYPLPNEEWVLGKSGLKALQYMALGIPTVATAIGTIHRIITDGHNGYLAASDFEWGEKISLLIENEKLRQEIGINAAATVNEKYSVKANKAAYLAVLDKLISS